MLRHRTSLYEWCGTSSSSVISNAKERIDLVQCSDVSDDAFISVEKGDLLKKSEDNTSVKLLHDSDDKKFVCITKGSAYLLR